MSSIVALRRRGSAPALLLLTWIVAGCGVSVDLACPTAFEAGGFLTNPTTRSVDLTLLPAREVEFHVEYDESLAAGSAAFRTESQRATPQSLAHVRLEDLAAGTTYRYRVVCDDAPSSNRTLQERRFTTLREPGDPFNFAFLSDSHVYSQWARSRELGDPVDVRGLRQLEQTLRDVAGAGVDFMIAGGDEAMTHCNSCPESRFMGEPAGSTTVQTRGEAIARYRVLRRYFGRVAHSVPFLLVLGNHDGEAGFGDAAGTCRHFDTTRALSRAARLHLLPNPAEVHRGAPDGEYFAFESGDALFVVLDVTGYTTDYPRAPDDWTLGPEQLAWLDQTLAESSRRWKFVFSHHLVGGHPRQPCYAYGRGSLKATVDGRVEGRLAGEQARIHALMREHRAQFFIHGHDHVFAFGEKRDAEGRPEGIYYVSGGQSSATHSPWVGKPWFDELYDYDRDGQPDYERRSGFLRVSVSPEEVRFEYRASDPDRPERKPTVLFQTTVAQRP